MRRFVFLFLLSLPVLFSCSKPAKDLPADTPEQPVGNHYQIEASTEPVTKAAPQASTLQVLWQVGDRIGLVDADGVITPAILDEDCAGQSTGTFSYYASEPVIPVYAYYPYTGNETLRGTVLSLSLPSNQAAPAEGMMVPSGSIVMSAKKVGSGLVFKNACAIAAFQIKGPASSLSKMSLLHPGRAFCGSGSMDLAADAPVWTPSGVESRLSVTLDNLSLSPSTAATVYAVLPAGSYEELRIHFEGTAAGSTTPVEYDYASTTPYTLTAGHVQPMNLTLEEKTSTIYGQVLCEGQPVPGVVVSDGQLVATTDETGTYKLASEKKEGLVFISVPSGYTVAKGYGAIPSFWKHTAEAADVVERIDFQLQRQNGQDNHRVYLVGDVHGMYSNNATEQFAWFVSDLNKQAEAYAGPQVAVQMGDSTWDYIWYSSNPFKMPDYLAWGNSVSIPMFNCMGNHDGDMYQTSDWLYGRDFRDYFGPTYYSFNMGKVHYVVLDDVRTCNDGSGTAGRDYRFGHSEEQLAWLQKDLSYVPTSTPLVVLYHIQMLNRNGSQAYSAYGNMSIADFVAPFSAYSNVRYYAAHTHNLYSAKMTVSGKTVNEQNVSAICADFWGSGSEDERNLMCRDGSPSGYRVLDVNDKNFKDSFRVTGRDNYLFRAYDRNSIHLVAEDYIPEAGPNHKAAWQGILGEFASVSTANYVYIYTWDWKSDWTLSVTENGNKLSAVEISVKDPLYMISRTVVNRCNKADSGSYSLDMTPTEVTKVFRVKASSATSSLIITMTDSYGNSRTEIMHRPKAFNLSTYATEGFDSASADGDFLTPQFEYDESMSL